MGLNGCFRELETDDGDHQPPHVRLRTHQVKAVSLDSSTPLEEKRKDMAERKEERKAKRVERDG